MSAYSPPSPGEPEPTPAATSERNPFARPLPGEDEAPTLAMSRPEIAAAAAAAAARSEGSSPRVTAADTTVDSRPAAAARSEGSLPRVTAADTTDDSRAAGAARSEGWLPPSPSAPDGGEVSRNEPAGRARLIGRPAGRRAAAGPGGAFDVARARTWLLGVAAILALLLAIGGVGYLISRPGTPISISGREGPLSLPDKAGDYTREQSGTPVPSQHGDGRVTLTAAYERGGKGQFVVLASRPEKDAASALAALQAVGVQTAPGGACGRIGQQTACAVMASGSTALVGVTQVDQSKDELLVALRRVAEAMR